EYQGLGLRDLADGRDVFGYAGSHHHTSAGLALSPDGELLAVAEGNNLVRLWSVASGKTRGGWPSEVHSLAVAAFSPGGRLLAVAGHDGVQLWDVLTRQRFPVWRGHQGAVKALAFAPDSTVLATAACDGTVLVWDITGRLDNGRLAKLTLTPMEIETAWK